MSTSARQTVHAVPRVPSGAMRRERLLERIGRAPVTVLRAPGGSGKTVVMAQWAEQEPRGGAWLTVEPDIGGRLAFWSAVSALLTPYGVVISAAELAAVHEEAGGRDAFTSMLVRAFLSNPEQLVLVIDDAHNLGDARIAEDLLAVVTACRTVQLVLATRSASRFEAPDVALVVDTELIEPGDIAFSVAEVAHVAGGMTGHGSASLDAGELHAATGGNALLMRAVLHGGELGPGDSHHDRAHVAIREYWAAMTRADRELGSFSMKAAIPDDFDQQLARTLSGLGDVERYVATLEHEGLIMRTEEAHATRFRFHPLVREVLRAEFRRTSKPGFRRLSAMASVAASGRRNHGAALRHAVDADDFELASSVILDGGLPMIRGGEAAAVLRGTPLRHTAQYPLIGFVLALSANARGERWRALELFALSLTASRATRSRQSPAECIVLDTVESIVLRVTGRASESVASARRALARIERAAESELRQIAPHLGSLRVHCAITLLRGGALAEAAGVVERMHADVRTDHATAAASERMPTLAVAAAVSAIRGRMTEADRALRAIDECGLPREVLNSYSGALAHLARAIGGIEAGDMRRVRAHISALDAHMPTLEYRLLFSALQALARLWDGEAAEALHELTVDQRRETERKGVSRSDERVLAATRVLLHAALGETGAANQEIRRLRPDDELRMLLDAHLMIIGRRPELAFPRLLKIHPGEHDDRIRAARDMLLACAALSSGDRDATATALRRYASTATMSGLRSPLVLVPVELRGELLAFADSLGGPAAVALAPLPALPPVFRLARPRVSLTPREREIVLALGTDATSSEIAERLGVAQNTLKSQTRTLYRKLEVGARAEAVRAAYANGLLPVDPQPPQPAA